MHPFIPVLSPSFLYHPYIPSFKSKDFSFTCLLSFFAAHCILALRNILPGAIYCCLHTCCVYVVLSELYVRQLSLLHTNANMGQLKAFLFILKRDCQRLFVVVYKLVMLICVVCNVSHVYRPAFIVTSADISQLWVYLCYLLIYCLRLFVVVYKLVMFMSVGDIVLHMCTNFRGHLC